MFKISYIGANGKIGRNVLMMLVNRCPNPVEVMIVLLQSRAYDSSNKLNGLVRDLYSLVFALNKNIKFMITDKYENTINSDIIICSAGITPTQEQKVYFKKFDNTGRLAQAAINKDMIIDIGNCINTFSQQSLFLLVTNQVDILCELLRSKFELLNIVGVGGFVDTIRFRQLMYHELNIKTNAFVIGYHNNDMFVNYNDIKIENINESDVECIMHIVKQYGSIISKEQGYGSNILPALAIVDFVCAYLFNKTIVNSYNVKITDCNIDNICNISYGLSVPIEVSYKKIRYVDSANIYNNNNLLLQHCINNLKHDIELISTIS